MLFAATPAPSRSRRRTRAIRSLQLLLVLAFSLFISVANATAQEEPADPNAPVEQPAPVVEEAPEPQPEPEPVVEQPAPVEDPAPVVEDAPVVEETPAPVEQPAPVDEEAPADEVAGQDAPDVQPLAAPEDEVAKLNNDYFCHQSGSGWTSVPVSGLSNAHKFNSNHSFDVIDTSGFQKNAGLFVRGDHRYNGATLLANGCDGAGAIVATDACANINGFQEPGDSCRRNELVGGPYQYCHASLFIIWWSYSLGSTSNLNTLLWLRGQSRDSVEAFSYYDSSGALVSLPQKGDFSECDDYTPPPPADVCDNIAGDQASVPADRIQVGSNCVPPAVSCDALDQLPLDDGSTTDSVANDGVTDACQANPPVTCDPLDQTDGDSNGNGITDHCVAAPPVTCDPLDQTDGDSNGNGITDHCVPNPASCDKGEGEDDTNGNGIIDTCVDITCEGLETPTDTGDNDVMDTCLPVQCDTLDEYGFDAGGNGVEDECRFVAPPACPVGVLVDRNGNGNMDLCAVVTPSLQCKVTDKLGNTTLHWNYNSNSTVSFTELNSMLIGGSAGSVAPTTFSSSGSWTSGLQSGTTNSAWLIHSQIAIGSHQSTSCYNECPNLNPEDEQTVPAGMVKNGAGNCVPEPPSCQFDERGDDDGSTSGSEANDGVIDVCTVLPDRTDCAFDETATDTNANGSLDTCVPNPDVAGCDFDETATDTNGNGSKDTCVPKPSKWCGLKVGVDTNANGSLDTCVSITPIIDCGVYNANGTRTLKWRWRNASGHAVTIPVGLQNAFFSVNQPTSFPVGEGSFETTLTGPGYLGLNSQAWFVTGNTAVGFWSSAITPRCFPDACPNLVGDQDGVPSGMAINDRGRCVAETTSCEYTDYAPSNSDGDSVNDTCVAVPVTTCDGSRVPVDTNDNGNPDDCGSVQPTLSCVTNLVDGSSTARFTWTNANPSAVTIPVGDLNRFTGTSFTGQPTDFPVGTGAAFEVTIPAATVKVSWDLTGIRATAKHDSTPCFEDSCPNVAGDQDGVPGDLVVNDAGNCVAQPPSCDDGVDAEEKQLRALVIGTGEKLVDSDNDGVDDTCAPISCADDHTPTDTGSNGVADTCVAKSLECPANTEPQDLIPAGAPNGVMDTCVAKATAPDGAGAPGDSTGGAGTPGDGTDGAGAPGDADGETPDTTDGEDGSGAPVDSADDDGEALAAGDVADDDDLPLTGAALGLLAVIGAGTLLGGSALKRTRRRDERVDAA